MTHQLRKLPYPSRWVAAIVGVRGLVEEVRVSDSEDERHAK